MPAKKPTDGSCGVLGVLVVWTAPLASSKATTSVNVPPVSNASRYRAIGPQRTSARSARRCCRRGQGHQSGHPAFHSLSRTNVDPIAAAGHAAPFEDVENQPFTEGGDRPAGHRVGAQDRADTACVADDDSFAGGAWTWSWF